MSNLRDRLDIILNDNNLTKSDLARMLGIRPQAVSMIYSRDNTSYQTAKQIADLFNINVDWLLTGEGEMKKALSWEDEVAQIAVEMYGDKYIEERIDLIRFIQSLTIEDIRMLKRVSEKYRAMTENKDAIKKEEQG